MPTCSSCDQKLEKSRFTKEQLKLGVDRVCKGCSDLTASLFKTTLSTRRFDEVSADAQVERLRSNDPNTVADAANKLYGNSTHQVPWPESVPPQTRPR